MRKEIENYIFDIEILKKLKPDIDEHSYHEIILDIREQDIKTLSSKFLKLCGLNNVMNVSLSVI